MTEFKQTFPLIPMNMGIQEEPLLKLDPRIHGDERRL